MKKLLAITLSLLMVFALIPAATLTASAATATVSTEADLRTYLSNNAADTLTLGADITITSQIKNATGKSDNLNLAGFTITYAPTDATTTDAGIWLASSSYDNSALLVTNTGTTGGFVDNAENAYLFKTDATQGKLSLGTGTYNGNITIDNAGSVNPLNITGATTVVNANVEATGNVNPLTNGIQINGKMDVKGILNTQWFKVTFNNDVTAYDLVCGNAASLFNNPVVVTNELKTTGATSFKSTVNVKDSYIGPSVFDGKFTAQNLVSLAGKFNAPVDISNDLTAVGGTFVGLVTPGKGKTQIVGATFTGADYASTFASTVSIKGGVFSFDPTVYLANGSTVAENKGVYTATYNAFDVNGTAYDTLNNANAAAADGDKIKLVEDYYITSGNQTLLNLTKNNITIDLNGFNITDFSDKCYFGNRKFINCTTDTVTDFTLTDSTYATTGGGKITIQGGSNQGGTEENIRFNALNSVDTPINLLFENVTITTTSSQDNNGGQYLFSGTSTNADNKIVFKNLKQLHTGAASISSTGYNGMTYSVAAPLTIENSTLECNRNTITLNKEVPITIKNSTITASKFGPINLNAKTDLKIEGSVINANVGGPSGGPAIKVATADSIITAKATTFNIDNSNALASSSTTVGEYTAKFNSCEFNLTNSSSAFKLQAAEKVTVNNGKFNLNFYNAKVADLSTNATLTIDKNTIVTGTADTQSSYANTIFTIKGTSADVISTLNINSMTATNVRNFITSGNEFNKVYIEDMDFTKDSKAGQWNSGWAFASASTNVTLGDGYQVTTYVKDVEAVRENYVWSTGENNKRIVVSNPNLRLVSIADEQYKVNAGSEFTFPANTDTAFKGYTDRTKLYQPGEKVVINENITYYVITKLITDADFTVDTANKTYSGSAIEPSVTSEIGEGNYKVAYSDNVNAGTAKITITADGIAFGVVEKSFTIDPKDITDSDFEAIAAQTYNNKELTPALTSTTLAKSDYDAVYSENVNVGTAKVAITGKGNYKSTVNKTFVINKKTITDTDFTFDLADKTYTTEEIKPEATSTALKATDFKVEYSQNTNVGTAKITVTGLDNCEGTIEKEFKIVQKAIADTDFTFDLADKTYTTAEIKPVVTSTLKDGDYEVAYSENTNVGTAKITVTGKGNYSGTIEKEFKIVQKAIADTDFTFDLADKTYTTAEIKPVVTSTLKDGDYEVAYSENINAGTAKITVTGKGNYSGTIEKEFKIVAVALKDTDFNAIADQVYAAAELKPTVVAVGPMVEATDYDVVYTNNINKGEATVTITGKGNYSGTIILHFNITVKTIADTDFTFDLADKTYTTEEIKPEVTSATLKATDFKVEYSENTNVGTAKITVTGLDNCEGTIEKEFKIVEKAIADTDFTFDLTNKTYTGVQIQPDATSTLKPEDYEISFSNNINVGLGKITAIGKGNYNGTVEKTFKITQKAIASSNFSVNTSTVSYTGKAITKTVSSKLVKNRDYTVTFSNNKNVGKATIIIKGIGNYSGTIVKTFTIKVPSVARISKVTVKAAKKSLKASWKKVSGANGYIIKVSAKKNFKGAKTYYVSSKTLKKTLSKLKAGTKYYVKVAAYKNYKNSKNKTVKQIGAYRTAKAVKTK